MAQELPLFPLHVVLFPGMMLPLHVVEDRYKVMVSRCLDGDRSFGVVAIRAAEEAHGLLIPHSVGTVAAIAKVEKLEDDAMNLVTVGERRFKIIQLNDDEPYPRAMVEYLPSDQPVASALTDVSNLAIKLFKRHTELLFAAAGREAPRIKVPAEPEPLSFLIAGNMRVPIEAKQRLLEIETARQRLALEIEMLKVENDTLKAILHTAGPVYLPDDEMEDMEDEDDEDDDVRGDD